MTPSFTKKELRIVYKQKRNALSSDEVIFLSKKIFDNFIKRFDVKANDKIHCFITIPEKKEIDTSFFFNYFFENNIRVFVPKMIGDNLVSIELFPDSLLEANNWGVIEPVGSNFSDINDFDICITPLLYCDKNGNRIGYGKGFYDKFFSVANVKNKIGINFFDINEIVSDFDYNDISVDYLVTPFSVKEFALD